MEGGTSLREKDGLPQDPHSVWGLGKLTVASGSDPTWPPQFLPPPHPCTRRPPFWVATPPPHPRPKAASAPLQDLLPWEHFLAVLPAGGARLLLCSTPRRLACVCPCPPTLAQPPLAASLLPSSCSAAGQLCFWHFPLAWGCYGPNCVSQRSYWNPQSDGIWRWTVGEARVR